MEGEKLKIVVGRTSRRKRESIGISCAFFQSGDSCSMTSFLWGSSMCCLGLGLEWRESPSSSPISWLGLLLLVSAQLTSGSFRLQNLEHGTPWCVRQKQGLTQDSSVWSSLLSFVSHFQKTLSQLTETILKECLHGKLTGMLYCT